MPDTTIIVSGLALVASALSAAIAGWFALRGKREDAIGKHALSALMDQAEFREDLMKQLARCQTHTSRLEADMRLNVGTGPLKAMGTAGSFADVEFDGSAWALTAYGTL
ncbi:MAG: hypothetical protein AB7Q76_22700 [Gammaproteobacteria bacterium]